MNENRLKFLVENLNALKSAKFSGHNWAFASFRTDMKTILGNDAVRITELKDNAFEYKLPKGVRYDVVWHDIWDYITSDNLPEMIKLHRKYGRKCDYQESWCRYRCECLRRQGC